jgi:hypothetical protein
MGMVGKESNGNIQERGNGRWKWKWGDRGEGDEQITERWDRERKQTCGMRTQM